MKRIISLACIILLSHAAKSQVLISLLLGDKLNTGKIEFGLDGGWNLADIKGISEAKMTSRFNIGFYFDFKLKNPDWMFHTGVIVKSTMGAEGLPVYSLNNAYLDTVFTGGTVERKINFFCKCEDALWRCGARPLIYIFKPKKGLRNEAFFLACQTGSIYVYFAI